MLFPTIEPYHQQYLKVSPTHKLYVEECGNPKGLPVIFVHGGPGSGCHELDRCFFDPQRYRIILFDQRGAGRSKPLASLEQNTTQNLVSDMEKIRQHFGIERWLVFGGSWGSLLSLVYAETHPDRVMALIVRGIFLGTEDEINWIFSNNAGMSHFYPDEFEAFRQGVSGQEPLLSAYFRALSSDIFSEQLKAAEAWLTWEARGLCLNPPTVPEKFDTDTENTISMALIECHYFLNRCFLNSDQIMSNASTLASIPVTIIQGRYDMLCRPLIAWRLHQALPHSQIHFAQTSGHISRETETAALLIKATQDCAAMFE